MNKSISPQKIVIRKKNAQEKYYELKYKMEQYEEKKKENLEITKDDESSYAISKIMIGEYEKIINEEINLGDTELKPSIVSLKLTEAALKNYSQIFDPTDIKYNNFAFVGEFLYARGHIIVIGISTGRNYCMINPEWFIISTD